MELKVVINLLGLIIDVVGAILIFRNSPEVSFNTFLYDDEELKTLNKLAAKKIKLSKTGMGLLIIGFILQGISVIL